MCRTDPFAKKDWYDIKAPNVFEHKNVGKTLVSRTQGTKVYLSICILFHFLAISRFDEYFVFGLCLIYDMLCAFICYVLA